MKPSCVVWFLILCTQCNSSYSTLQDDDTQSIVEGIKVIGQSGTKHQFQQIQFKTFGKLFTFKLTPTTIFSPNFKILQNKIQEDDYDSNIIEDLTLQKSESLSGSFYTDENNHGSFYIQEVNGQIQMDGIVDDTMRIWSSNGHHMASKISNQNSNIGCPTIEAISNHSSAKRLPGFSKVATVEVLVLLDQIIYKNLSTHHTSIKKYLGIFWNFVQNKFRATSKPKVQLSLSGVVVLDDFKWISNSFIQFNTPDANKILESLGEWLYKEQKKFPLYDVSVLHTGLDLAHIHGNQLGREIVGVATTTGVCKNNAVIQRMLNCGIIEDHNAPLYSGLFTGAHELAHLLGSHHDDPTKCTKNSIMATIKPKVNANVITFSDCTLDAIHEQLNHPDAECVYNTRHSDIPILPEVPNLTRDQICKLQFGETSAEVQKEVYNKLKKDPCEMVLCYLGGSGASRRIKYMRWVPEGTSCFGGRICIQGNCIAKLT